MNENPKIFIATGGIIVAVFMIIYGAILPVLKAQAYINAARSASSIRTIQDFESNFNKVFNFYSPIGGEESAKFLLSNILTVLNGQKDQPENVTRKLIDYIEPKIYPDTRHYLAMANLYTVALTRFRIEDDYKKAVEFYSLARQKGPKLPPVLYGLLALYQASGDTDGIKDVGGEILKSWPGDTRVSDLIMAMDLLDKNKK